MTKLTNFFTRYEGCFPTRRGRRLQAAVIAGILVGLLGLVACAGQPATQTARPTSTPELLTEEPSTATALLAPTPTPEPLPTGTTASRLLKKGVSVKLPCRWSQEHDDVRL